MGLNLWSLSREKRDKIDSRLEILGERKSSAITPHLEGVTISPKTVCTFQTNATNLQLSFFFFGYMK